MGQVQPTGWNDYLFPGLTLPRTAANAPTVKTYRGNINALAFAGTGALEETWAVVHILHDYDFGTKLFPHIHWSHIIGAPSGSIVWQIEYSVAKSGGGIFPAATTEELIVTPATQYEHQVIETSDANAIPITNLEPDSVIMFRIFRDPAHGSDNFENDAFLLYFDMHFKSDETLTSEKVTPFTKRLSSKEVT